jgi:histidine triad (HIT) family protein
VVFVTEDCVFCKIVNGEIQAQKVYEDDKYLAFMDAFPSLKGQVLVIPKKHVKNYLDMEKEEYKDLMSKSREIAKAMKKAFNPEVVALVIEGMEVPHVHVKLYPIRKGEYLGIPAGEKATEEELKKLSEEIKKQL